MSTGLAAVAVLACSASAASAAAGDLDLTFGSGGKVTTDFASEGDAALGVALQADGKIVAAGGGPGDFALARYNSDGSLDAGFGSGGKVTTDFGRGFDAASAVAIQADGKIVAAGVSAGDFALARYNSDGSLDGSFGNGGKVTTDFGSSDQANAIAIQADGKIVAAGNTFGPSPDFALARYNPDGSLDGSFGNGGKVTTDFGGFDFVHEIAVQGDGKIAAAGSGPGDFTLARYNPDGSLDASFGSGGKVTTDFGSSSDQAFGVDIQADGKIVAAGAGPGDFALARYNPDGSLDAGFGSGGKVTTDFSSSSDQANSVAIQADGKIVAAGAGPGDFALARYNPDGSLDASFGSGGKVTTDFAFATDNAWDVAIQADGKIVAAGNTFGPGFGDFALARYLGDAIVPPQRADLTVNKVDERDPVAVGATFRYVIFLGSNGPDAAEGVVVTDRLPTSVVFVGASSTRGSCSAAGGVVTCSLGRLRAGRTATIEITVRPTEVGIIRDRATVTAGTFDPDTSNNSDVERTTVVGG